MDEAELTLEEIVEELYYDGWRSCEWIEFKAFVKPGTDLFNEIDEEVEIPTWHALRAYQDEQRKKGEPIRYKLIANAPEWPVLSEVTSDEFGPIEVGRFINFRWRPGHPTESELTFLRPGHGPKGGSNG